MAGEGGVYVKSLSLAHTEQMFAGPPPPVSLRFSSFQMFAGCSADDGESEPQHYLYGMFQVIKCCGLMFWCCQLTPAERRPNSEA